MAVSNAQQFMDYGLDNIDETRRLVRRLESINPDWMISGRSNKATAGNKPAAAKKPSATKPAAAATKGKPATGRRKRGTAEPTGGEQNAAA